jgi:hypothetical protein
MKIPRYSGIPHELYFVVVAPEIIQENLEIVAKNKKKVFLSNNQHLVTLKYFIQLIEAYPRFRIR